MMRRSPDNAPATTAGSVPARRSRQRGHTIVEMAVSASLIVAVLGITYTAADVVNSVNHFDQAKLRQEVSYRDVLHKVRKELMHCSTEKDPRTNIPRYAILTDKNGKQTLRVQKIVGAQLVDKELTPTWSSDIEFFVDKNSRVARRQDGRIRYLGGGFKSMTFSVTSKGAFRIVAVTRWRHPKTGEWKDVTHVVETRPIN